MSEECYSDKAAASMENALEQCRQERDSLKAQNQRLRSDRDKWQMSWEEDVHQCRQERDKLRAQVAVMREALEHYAHWEHPADGRQRAIKALSAPAPPVVPRDKARQIAEALKALDDYLCKGVKHTVSVCGALATARELGLLEEK